VVVPESVNRGVPVVLHAPKSSVAKAFEELATEIAGVRAK
jgi:MinD-like ATPase involved in chromosome partitioning or flagellar assembly